MQIWADIRIKIRNFFKKHKKKIFIILIIYAVVFIINRYLASMEETPVKITTYEPHVSVMDDTKAVPQKLREPIEQLLDDFINYCNEKEYDKAYDLLSDECKTEGYPTMESFKEYVDLRFPNKKLYAIQDYSNTDGKYIYQIKIFNDILASGLTNEQYSYYDEKITIVKQNDELKLMVGKFLDKVDIKNVAEDDYLKIDIKTKTVRYDTETYHVKITNRSQYTAVLADNNVEIEEIVLDIGGEYRNRTDAYLNPIVLKPGEVKEIDLSFPKFYDDGDTSQNIIFNAIRIMEDYTGVKETAEEEINNAITKYSIKIKV